MADQWQEIAASTLIAGAFVKASMEMFKSYRREVARNERLLRLNEKLTASVERLTKFLD